MNALRRIFGSVDLHIVAMLLLTAPILLLALPFFWGLLGIALFPQGRIYVRAFWDYPKFKRASWPYLVANEGLVLAVVALCLTGWRLRHSGS
jgi:hypothetical protein